MEDKIQLVKELLKEHQIDGWLIYDFRHLNPLGNHFLEIADDTHLSRRFFYWIPAEGEPVKIVHTIEAHVLEHLPGEKRIYLRWNELIDQLKILLEKVSCVAMEVSPGGMMPTVSYVDGGTVDLVRSCQVEVISSAPFLLHFTAALDSRQVAMHKEAAKILTDITEKTWGWIPSQEKVTEYDVSKYILDLMQKNGCKSEGLPICAVNENSSNPHYLATVSSAKEIRAGDYVLIDLSCRKDDPNGIYADITQLGFLGKNPPEKQQEIFSIVYKAQEVATDFIKRRFENGEIVKGFEVDEVCRKVIIDAGFGEYFTHRTGHNMGKNCHGDGTNLDELETFDERPLIPRSVYTIEPGIYLPGEFGVRLEHDLYIDENGNCEITCGHQTEIRCL